jgi:hypothetical protein
MHSFKVVRDRFGWAVRLGPMTTPFWSLAAAVREANALCAGLRMHGVAAEVVIEDEPAAESDPFSRPGTSRGSAGAGHGRS